jgi:microcystin-dependent protein
MSNPFVAEIRIFAGNFPPLGWAFCDGQLMPISQNTALFSLLGTIYGGNGQSTFALPNLQGSAPMQWGQGPGLSLRDQGEVGGSDFVTLLQSEMPLHTHNSTGADVQGNVAGPSQNFFGGDTTARQWVNSNQNTTMNPIALSPAGGDLPHNNLQPYMVLTFIIALQGVFPARS